MCDVKKHCCNTKLCICQEGQRYLSSGLIIFGDVRKRTLVENLLTDSNLNKKLAMFVRKISIVRH